MLHVRCLRIKSQPTTVCCVTWANQVTSLCTETLQGSSEDTNEEVLKRAMVQSPVPRYPAKGNHDSTMEQVTLDCTLSPMRETVHGASVSRLPVCLTPMTPETTIASALPTRRRDRTALLRG